MLRPKHALWLAPPLRGHSCAPPHRRPLAFAQSRHSLNLLRILLQLLLSYFKEGCRNPISQGRTLGLRSQAGSMTALAVHACVPVDQRRVSRDAVCVPSSSQRSCSLSRSDLAPAETGLTVPESDRPELAPTHARLEVVTLSDMRVQQSQDRVRFFLLQADDTAREALVDVPDASEKVSVRKRARTAWTYSAFSPVTG